MSHNNTWRISGLGVMYIMLVRCHVLLDLTKTCFWNQVCTPRIDPSMAVSNCPLRSLCGVGGFPVQPSPKSKNIVFLRTATR